MDMVLGSEQFVLTSIGAVEHAKDGFTLVLSVPDEPCVEVWRSALPREVYLPPAQVDSGWRVCRPEAAESASTGPRPVEKQRHILDAQSLKRVGQPQCLAV